MCHVNDIGYSSLQFREISALDLQAVEPCSGMEPEKDPEISCWLWLLSGVVYTGGLSRGNGSGMCRWSAGYRCQAQTRRHRKRRGGSRVTADAVRSDQRELRDDRLLGDHRRKALVEKSSWNKLEWIMTEYNWAWRQPFLDFRWLCQNLCWRETSRR